MIWRLKYFEEITPFKADFERRKAAINDRGTPKRRVALNYSITLTLFRPSGPHQCSADAEMKVKL